MKAISCHFFKRYTSNFLFSRTANKLVFQSKVHADCPVHTFYVFHQVFQFLTPNQISWQDLSSLSLMSSETRTPDCADKVKLADDSWSLNYVTGNLFSSPVDEALAHCISEDCRMGAGIAVMFKQKFGGVPELKEQKKLTGQCAVLTRDTRFVYYLITKKKATHKPTYDSLRQSLEDMKSHCIKNGVTRISMPRLPPSDSIGCGLDRLKWSKVSEMLIQIFKCTDISITIYSLPQKTETTVMKEHMLR